MKKPAFSDEARIGALTALDRLEDISRRFMRAAESAPNGNGSADLMRGSLLAQVRAEILTDLGIHGGTGVAIVGPTSTDPADLDRETSLSSPPQSPSSDGMEGP
jgi:hypothetical protein